MNPLKQVRLRNYFTKAAILALALILVGVGCLFWASHIKDDESLATVVREVGAVLLAIGALDLLHQIFLQRDLTHDLLRAVGLQASVARIGLDDISQEPPDWNKFFSSGREFAVLPIDPVTWMRTGFAAALRAAGERPVKLTIYLPSAVGPNITLVAGRLGAPPAGFPDDLKSTADGVFDSWRHSGLQSGSELHIQSYEDGPGYGLAVAEAAVIVHLNGTSRAPIGSPVITCNFSEGRDSEIGRWCSAQLEGLSTIDPRTYTVP